MTKLICKNCGTPYQEDQNFCDKCGNPLPPFEKVEVPDKKITCPLCRRKISEKVKVCPYCGESISLESLIKAAIQDNKFRNYMQLGLGLSLGSFIVLFFYPLISLILATIGLVICIFGVTSKYRRIAITGTTFSVLNITITIILIAMVIGFDFSWDLLPWSIDLKKEEEPTLSDIIRYKEKLYTAWEEKSLLVLNEQGTFEWYQEKTNLKNNYQKGIFQLENGINTSEGKIFEDENYYYYQLSLFQTEVNKDGISKKEDIELKVYTAALAKDNFKKLIIQDLETEKDITFTKIKEGTVS